MKQFPHLGETSELTARRSPSERCALPAYAVCWSPISRRSITRLGQGEEPKAPRDAAGYGSIRMITEARNSGFAARGREQMGSDTCSASRTTGTYFQPNAW